MHFDIGTSNGPQDSPDSLQTDQQRNPGECERSDQHREGIGGVPCGRRQVGGAL